MTDKLNEEFEAWAVQRNKRWGKNFQIKLNKRVKLDGSWRYWNAFDEVVYEAWQASRAALVVELPKRRVDWGTDNWADGFNLALEICAKNIEAAGGKVAP